MVITRKPLDCKRVAKLFPDHRIVYLVLVIIYTLFALLPYFYGTNCVDKNEKASRAVDGRDAVSAGGHSITVDPQGFFRPLRPRTCPRPTR